MRGPGGMGASFGLDLPICAGYIGLGANEISLLAGVTVPDDEHLDGKLRKAQGVGRPGFHLPVGKLYPQDLDPPKVRR